MVQRRRHGRFHGSRPSRSTRPIFYEIVCAGCGKEVDMSRETRSTVSMLKRST